MKYIILLFVFISHLACNTTGDGETKLATEKGVNILNLDTNIGVSDSLRKVNDSLDILSKYKKGELQYRGYYIDGQLSDL